MAKSEDMSSTEIADRFVLELMNLLPFIKIINDFFMKIINIIPNSLSKIDYLSRQYIFNIVEIILLVLSITIINQYSPSKILQPDTPEGTIFIVFMIFIFFSVVHTSYLFLYKTDVPDFIKPLKYLVHSIPVYIIVFVFSFVLWFLMNILGWIQQIFSGIINGFNYGIEVLTKMLRDPNEASIVYKYGLLYAVIFVILVFLYLSVFKPSAVPKGTFTYLFSIVLPLILVMFLAMPLLRSGGSKTHILFLGMFVTFIVAAFYFFMKSDTKTNEGIGFISVLVTLSIILGGLSIAFYTFSNYLKTFTGWAGFFVYLIFYIPCLFIDLVKYILNEFKMTSSTIYVLLLFELIVILLYFYLPVLLDKIYRSNKFILLPKAAFLDIEQTIGNSEMNKMPENLQKEGDRNVYNQNYAISMWIYLNPQPSNNIGYSREAQIFNYGDGKPKLTYYNDTSNINNDYGHTGADKYRIYFTNSSSPKGYYEFSLPGQKWHNITVNFSSNKADLFINGKLDFTYLYKGNPPNYAPTDFVTVGESDGLDGAISNVIYYPQNLTMMEITSHYNMYSIKNPPY